MVVENKPTVMVSYILALTARTNAPSNRFLLLNGKTCTATV